MKISKLQWGNAQNVDYDIILDFFSGTKTNSIKTSSIPLAQHWKQTERMLEILSKMSDTQLTDAEVYFEYPTRSYRNNRASMSDVMVISRNTRVAVEGKYTEYDFSVYEPIQKWYEKYGRTENRNRVVQHWLNMIEQFSTVDPIRMVEIPYQLLHRTASACFGNPLKAIVLYQIFWDSESKNTTSFIEELKNAIRIIRPNPKLNFYIEKIEVKSIDKIDKEEAFERMKEKDVFEFGEPEWIKVEGIT